MLTRKMITNRIMHDILSTTYLEFDYIKRCQMGELRNSLFRASMTCRALGAQYQDEKLKVLGDHFLSIRSMILDEDIWTSVSDLAIQIGIVVDTHPSVAHLDREVRVYLPKH